MQLITPEEFDPVEARIEWLREQFQLTIDYCAEEGHEEYIDILLDAFDGVDKAYEAWQVYAYPDTIQTPLTRLERYKNEKKDN